MEAAASIIVGVLSLIGALMGTYFSNRRTTALLSYRMERLENEVRELGGFARITPVLEEKVNSLDHRLSSLEVCK